ncbi:MAG: hypothetical protein LBC02_03170 [Planctomycetaceae bacterium]|nr:hypothetical protein [Planctomycetaceae bacterium]
MQRLFGDGKNNNRCNCPKNMEGGNEAQRSDRMELPKNNERGRRSLR